MFQNQRDISIYTRENRYRKAFGGIQVPDEKDLPQFSNNPLP
ncbi:MAG TPA: hypothetical protein PKK64_10380 [Saprospiraceae bacterium]|nr:hypothetical protein [Saprospiraceae bacterium]HMX88287.1 hypothetical protein [Saprospiraceae bacterium]HMZ40429.1 hypothetical protein [Saprospiraceae bacterium]HNB30240.1 hypothetical protein [Saprospiraceae bacterium]HNC35605.1 hypothetical protein [Saprospiraceae bacterium]